MRQSTHAKKLTVYLGEDQRWQGQPLYLVILEMLKQTHIAGATVTKGFSGFSSGGQIHSVKSEYLMVNLPLMVEAIDEATKIDAAVEQIGRIPDLALVVVTPIVLLSRKSKDGEEPHQEPSC